MSMNARMEDCLIRIHKLLRARKLDHAIALMRAASSLLQCSPSYGLWLKREDKKYILQLCDTHRKNSGAGSSSDIRKSNPVRLDLLNKVLDNPLKLSIKHNVEYFFELSHDSIFVRYNNPTENICADNS
ncbi:hypothetical protein GQX74_012576 [Glossina fuscipes]|nr:hypothetical protein GQX74_012576 [Glossina fuscipes]